jgi:modulator of FtsH protease
LILADNARVDAAVDPEAWSDFAVMIGGASAAIAGLLVVALSISVEQILASTYLPRRAAAALVLSISPLVLAVLVLIPDQSATSLGVELLAAGVLLGCGLGRAIRPQGRSTHQSLPVWAVGSAMPVALMVVPTLLAGAGLVVDGLGGLYWLPVAVLAAILGGVSQAWVLLIEIRR